jgi:hypothetical protein
MKGTQLTSGAINGADQLSIELGEPDDAPATIWIVCQQEAGRLKAVHEVRVRIVPRV